MLVGYAVCKNIIITKFQILYVCKHKTSRSRIPRRIILYIIPTWLINVQLQIARVVMRLVRKSHLYFSRRRRTSQEMDYFVNCKNQAPTKYSVVCINHFHDKFIKHRKIRCKLNQELHPVPTIHPCVNSQPLLLNTTKVSRQPPRKRALSEADKFEVFTNRGKIKDFTQFTSEHTRGGCRELALLPMQHPKMGHINFQS